MVYLKDAVPLHFMGLALSVQAAVTIIAAFIGSIGKLILSLLNEKYDNYTFYVCLDSVSNNCSFEWLIACAPIRVPSFLRYKLLCSLPLYINSTSGEFCPGNFMLIHILKSFLKRTRWNPTLAWSENAREACWIIETSTGDDKKWSAKKQ